MKIESDEARELLRFAVQGDRHPVYGKCTAISFGGLKPGEEPTIEFHWDGVSAPVAVKP